MSTIHSPATEDGMVARVRKFFYAEETPFGLAIVRIIMPLVLIVPMLPRWFRARELYSLDGAPTPLWVGYGVPDFLPLLPGGVVVALHSALLFLLLTSSLGWCTRFSLAASTIIYTYLNLCDSVSTMTKYSVIASHAMLLLSVSNCGAIWSIDSWLAGRRRRNAWPGEPSVELPKFPAWPRRLMQLMIGAVYFGAAVTKMHTPAFFSGDQLQSWMLTNVNYNNPLGEFLALYPALLVNFAYITIVWEVMFIFLAWKGLNRYLMLFIGVTFHFMTLLTLGLFVFPAVCITTYFSFVNEDDVRRVSSWFRKLRRKRGRALGRKAPVPLAAPRAWKVPAALQFPPAVLFGLAALAVAGVGVELEHQYDPYGMRRAEGPFPLKKLDSEVVKMMLSGTRKLREKDKFNFFDVGTDTMGGIVLNRKTVFRQGETVIAQASLNSPHEDMWVECNLHDANNAVIDRIGRIVPREALRVNYTYHLSAILPPGDYFLVLKSAGQEVTRRRITLEPGPYNDMAANPMQYAN